MSSIRESRNIAGNVEQLNEYKKEIYTSTEKIIFYWSMFIIGIWINEQTKEYTFLFKDFILGRLPALILFFNLIHRWIRDMNTYYTSGETSNKENESLQKENVNVKFSEYIRKYPECHPILTLCIIGLIINQIYFIDQYENLNNVISKIPLIGTFYESRFSIVNMILFIFIGNYISFVKNNMLRYVFKAVLYINIPIIIAGEILGICSIFIFPITSVINSNWPIIEFKNWIVNTTNFLVILFVPMVLVVLYRLSTIRELNAEIDNFNKVSDKDLFLNREGVTI